MITRELREMLKQHLTLLSQIRTEECGQVCAAIEDILRQYPEPKFSIGDWVLANDFEDIDDNLIWEIDEMYFTKDGEWRYCVECYCLGVWCSEDELELVKRKGE